MSRGSLLTLELVKGLELAWPEHLTAASLVVGLWCETEAASEDPVLARMGKTVQS